jgi:hypothetical protein
VDDFSNHSLILLGCDGFIIDAFNYKYCIYRYIFMDFLYNNRRVLLCRKYWRVNSSNVSQPCEKECNYHSAKCDRDSTQKYEVSTLSDM